MRKTFLCLVLLLCIKNTFAQTVNVLFRYQSTSAAAPARVHFPGQFNNWGPNSSGVIASGTPSQATFNSATGLWERTVTLSVGSYQYKINENGAASGWRSDPLNRQFNPQDNDNSILAVGTLTLFQPAALPYAEGDAPRNQRFLVRAARPTLTAGIFTAQGVSVSSLTATLDGAAISNAQSFYNGSTGIFSFVPTAAISDGAHVFRISATSSDGVIRSDSVQFEVRARLIQLETPNFTTRKSDFNIGGFIADSSITSVQVSVNGGAAMTQAVSQNGFERSVPLQNGRNVIRISATQGGATTTDSVVITRFVPTAPVAVASVAASGATITLSAAQSSDPQNQTMTFTWRDVPGVPLGLNGRAGVTVDVAKPAAAGDYPFVLIARDADGNADTVRQYFTVRQNGDVILPRYETAPDWVRQMRLYLLFPKAASNQNSSILRDLIQRGAQPGGLEYIRNMGFNTIWMMPVMRTENNQIDNFINIGFNIVDFYNVVGSYGANQDFKDFVNEAHRLGLKVILDVTPNHTGRNHPWAQDARRGKTRSPYWNWYQHTVPTSGAATNTNGLGWGTDRDGFVFYGGFSEALLNFDWSDIDARNAMLDVYKHWIKEYDLDGYRFDVYWGPHRRYGKENFDQFLRSELKRVKGDIYLLAESDGTGVGSETIFADNQTNGARGGVDAGYDWKLYGSVVRNFNFTSTAIDRLHAELFNGGFYPGANSYYMRFMENKDEDRVSFLYRAGADTLTTYRRTMPMASVIFSSPGHPLLYTGQEVGAGFPTSATNAGEPDLNVRRRGVVNWSNFGRQLLTPHYQRLAHIRAQFPAFWTQSFGRIATGNANVYGLLRPFENQNAVTTANFSELPQTVTLDLRNAGLVFTGGVQDGATYFVNNLYDNTRRSARGSELASMQVALAPYSAAIFTVSTTQDQVVIQNPLSTVGGETARPIEFQLAQNYPNPFNPTTNISYQLPINSNVSLKVYDLLGREVATLVDARQAAGRYSAAFNAASLASGIYFYRLSAGTFAETKKMMLIK